MSPQNRIDTSKSSVPGLSGLVKKASSRRLVISRNIDQLVKELSVSLIKAG